MWHYGVIKLASSKYAKKKLVSEPHDYRVCCYIKMPITRIKVGQLLNVT